MGYYIDKTNQDIPVNTTHIYLDKESYDIATKKRNNSELLFTTNTPKEDNKRKSEYTKTIKKDELSKNKFYVDDIPLNGLLGRLILDSILDYKNREGRC